MRLSRALDVLLLGLLSLVAQGSALQDGVARTPPLGWSTWLSFRLNVSESLLRTSTDFLASSPLKAAGYEYILLDDGWPTCLKLDASGHCLELPPRDENGRIPVDPHKFPNGFKPITDYVHSKGLKIGIYTGVSNRTCGGYMGSLFHEAVDAAAFADWGFDFVKHDTCSPGFCGVYNDSGRDGTGDDGNCIKRSTTLMSQGLQATGKEILYYIDHGNPTSPQKIYNPFLHGVNPDLPGRLPGHPPLVPGTAAWDDACGWNSLALKPSELGWTWGSDVCHMMKSWYDRDDSWESFLSNMHNQIRIAEYQHCGFFHSPDMLTIGMGGQTQSQYRAQMLMYAILGAPIIIAADIRSMETWAIDLYTAPEVLAVDQDKQCIQGSLSRAVGASEIWVRPLSDGSFAAVLLNKGESPANISLVVAASGDNNDFFPALFTHYTARDVLQRKALNGGKIIHGDMTTQVPAMDAVMIKIRPTDDSSDGVHGYKYIPSGPEFEAPNMPDSSRTHNKCNPSGDGGCTVCADCCYTYIAGGEMCDECVRQRCK